MGAYLSEPVVDKQTEAAKGERGIHYGATSMQGWRINQEDAHNCILNFDENCSLFAVYDGHGGAEVAQYAAMRFPEYVKSTSAWKEGRIGQALEDAFLAFDELLTRNDVMEELKVLAGSKKKENESDEPDEDKALLYEEACLPLDDLLRRYGVTIDGSMFVDGNERRFINPKIKIKREKRPAAKATVDENVHGPPTPPSSPDAKSATAPTSTTEKCDASSNQESDDTLPTSPVQADSNSSAQSKRLCFAIKRKSRVTSDSNENDGDKVVTLDGDSHESAEQKSDNHGVSQTNGMDGTDSCKTSAARADSPLEGIHGKRFKSDKLEEEVVADSTTLADESNATSVSAGDGKQAVNGKLRNSSETEGGTGVDSTSDGYGENPLAKSITDHHASIAGATCGNVGSPMIVEEPSSTRPTNEKTTGTKPPATGTKSCAMDESSGASEDDEDEDFNMEVEDEESSEESSASDGIEEDEVVDEQDEMGVDAEEAEDEEEEEEEADDDDMFAMPSGDTPGVDSGTTACVVVIRGSSIYIANAGDSRCVLCRGDKAVDLSMDHKPEDIAEKRRIELAGGKITGDGRVNGGLNLSRAIGDHFYKRNSELPLRDQMITALPDVRVESMKPEDQFMVLACDGIWNSMNSQDVVDFIRVRLAKGLAPATVCEQLCDVCLAPNTIGDGTGCDNMTAIVVLLNQNLTGTNPMTSASSDHADQGADDSEAEAKAKAKAKSTEAKQL